MRHPSATRRELLGSVAGALGSLAAAAVATRAGIGRLDAASSTVDRGATVDAAARRIPPPAKPTRGTLRFPTDPAAKTYVLDNFGDCRGGSSRAHLGIDILGERGRAVYAVRPGVLTSSWDGTGTAGLGWTLLGDDDVTYRYQHLDALTADLRVGSRVPDGAVIGVMGSTGNDTSENVHLHFEVKFGETWVDPLPLLALAPTATVSAPLKTCLGLL
jgi:murein DD-endopeptidase MepM/ murein hydrolase activator NlpD